MSQKTLSILLKAVIIGVALCLVAVYAWIIPDLGTDLALAGDGEFSFLYVPWLIIVELTALPIIAALVIAWIIAGNIGRDKSFCKQNAKLLAVISLLAAADGAYFFIANIVMLLLNYSHPGMLIFSILACFAAIGICIAAAALSHLVYKAAKLQEQSDLTI